MSTSKCSPALRMSFETVSKLAELLAEHDAAFAAWYDYALLLQRLPLEAQVYEAWYFALYPEKLASHNDPAIFSDLFPSLVSQARPEMKSQLRSCIERNRHDPKINADPGTEQLPL